MLEEQRGEGGEGGRRDGGERGEITASSDCVFFPITNVMLSLGLRVRKGLVGEETSAEC